MVIWPFTYSALDQATGGSSGSYAGTLHTNAGGLMHHPRGNLPRAMRLLSANCVRTRCSICWSSPKRADSFNGIDYTCIASRDIRLPAIGDVGGIYRNSTYSQKPDRRRIQYTRNTCTYIRYAGIVDSWAPKFGYERMAHQRAFLSIWSYTGEGVSTNDSW